MPFPVKTDILDVRQLFKNKKIILNFAIIILAVFLGGSLYSRQNRVNMVIKDKIILESKKNELFKKLTQSEKEIFHYKELLKRRELSQVINRLTRFAQDLDVKVLSVRPEREKDYPIYTKLSVRLSLLAQDYHGIGKFISQLESAPDIFKIDTLNIKSPEEMFIANKEEIPEEKRGLSIDMVITVFMFKG